MRQRRTPECWACARSTTTTRSTTTRLLSWAPVSETLERWVRGSKIQFASSFFRCLHLLVVTCSPSHPSYWPSLTTWARMLPRSLYSFFIPFFSRCEPTPYFKLPWFADWFVQAQCGNGARHRQHKAAPWWGWIQVTIELLPSVTFSPIDSGNWHFQES